MADKEYIEREAIFSKIVNTPFGVDCSGKTNDYRYGIMDGLVKKEHNILDMIEKEPAADVIEIPESGIGDLSDGYHTFNELYHHRAILFSVICNLFPNKAWKSKLHDTGDMYEGMFIVGIETPKGQATYHYDLEPYWDIFKVKELDKAPKWDGHTPEEAIERIATLSAADVVEVVRCKDCKHCHEYHKWNSVRYLGCNRIFCEVYEVLPNHFCSHGERKE